MELDPESRTYQFGLAYVLLNNGGAAEAAEVGKKLMASAMTDEDSECGEEIDGDDCGGEGVGSGE